MSTPGTRYSLEVHPRIPQRLARLEALANDLWYGWDRSTRLLFSRLHPRLWQAVGHSPKAMLQRVDESRLLASAEDPAFMSTYNRVLSAYDSYREDAQRREGAARMADGDLVAYFCAEFGLHESLPIYSGGLGILAGDHCKTASDLRLPFIGVGLLYRQGYFAQTIDAEGRQNAAYYDSSFDALPIEPVRLADGRELRVPVALAGRELHTKVWRARIGHVTLFLLDTDLPENAERDRAITFRLYGGDRATRIEQEIVLGIGGTRTLRALGIEPSVWHINEGHAAFLILERARGLIQAGLEFDAALEAVAASTVFTTHTAVAAGHDHFAEASVQTYFEDYCRELGVPSERLLALGRVPGRADFNMTALAVRGSRFQNGVSRVHAGVSSELLRELWPQVPPEESPITHVTNAVHVPTFLAPEWNETFARVLGMEWSENLDRPDCADGIRQIPDHMFWSVRQYLKSQMLHLVRFRLDAQNTRNRGSEAHLDRVLRFADPADPNVLTIGFGRRFATYKRATLLFDDLEALRRIVCDPQRPVVFVFAGKAHPADGPGQELIRRVAEVARMPEFEGRILLVEGYDLRLARRMVTGVDVWLNNPVYPLEASGTSGMKAAINGAVNLSVLDGWWEEGYDGTNGWAIKPAAATYDAARRDREEARTLYEILQDHVVPLYYARGALGFSPGWVHLAKRSMASILPHFNSRRMLNEYLEKFYLPASRQGQHYAADGHRLARELAQWKARVRAAWPGVALRRVDAPQRRMRLGEAMTIEVAARLGGLAAEDVTVELLLARENGKPHPADRKTYRFQPAPPAGGEEARFVLELAPEICGHLDYRIRMLPHHPGLTHALELGLLVWA